MDKNNLKNIIIIILLFVILFFWIGSTNLYKECQSYKSNSEMWVQFTNDMLTNYSNGLVENNIIIYNYQQDSTNYENNWHIQYEVKYNKDMSDSILTIKNYEFK